MAQPLPGMKPRADQTLSLNMRLLSHHELQGFGGIGEGMGMQLARDGRRIVWLAHESAPKNFTAVDVTDPCALADSMSRLLGGGPEWQAWSAAATQRYSSTFTAAHFQTRLVSALDSLRT